MHDCSKYPLEIRTRLRYDFSVPQSRYDPRGLTVKRGHRERLLRGIVFRRIQSESIDENLAVFVYPIAHEVHFEYVLIYCAEA